MIEVLIPTEANIDRLARIGRLAWEGRETAWDAAKFLRLAGSGTVLMLGDKAIETALIVIRIALDEAEILNLGVIPSARRLGIGRQLLDRAEEEAARLGVERLFLEVAVDNLAAKRLYETAGYEVVGQRRGYYLRPDGSRCDAAVMVKHLEAGRIAPLAGLGPRAGG